MVCTQILVHGSAGLQTSKVSPVAQATTALLCVLARVEYGKALGWNITATRQGRNY